MCGIAWYQVKESRMDFHKRSSPGLAVDISQRPGLPRQMAEESKEAVELT